MYLAMSALLHHRCALGLTRCVRTPLLLVVYIESVDHQFWVGHVAPKGRRAQLVFLVWKGKDTAQDLRTRRASVSHCSTLCN